MTDKGLARGNNEDSFLVNRTVYTEGSIRSVQPLDGLLVAVADGMGGVQGGEIASTKCLDKLGELTPDVNHMLLESTLKEIHQSIRNYGEEHQEVNGLGTTVSGIAYMDNVIYTFNVGDSRVYRYKYGFLQQLTKDDSLVQVLYESGQISREGMSTHPDKHIILEVLGGLKPHIDPAIYEVNSPIQKEDIFLVCSDGLTDFISHDEMEGLMSQEYSLKEMAKSLIDTANSKGGFDNITVILLRNIGQEDE